MVILLNSLYFAKYNGFYNHEVLTAIAYAPMLMFISLVKTIGLIYSSYIVSSEYYFSV